MKFLPSHSYGQFINNCIRLGYKPTHIERQNAIKEFLDKSWVNTYNKPIKLSKYRYEQLALQQDNVISVACLDRQLVRRYERKKTVIDNLLGKDIFLNR